MASPRESHREEQIDGERGSPEPVRDPGPGVSTILVVDDEPVLRSFTVQVLELEGYVVFEAGGTAEALRVASAQPGPIDLVISDVVMSHGDDGRDLVERLGRMRPAIKALYISGHSEAEIARGGALLSAAFLQKPFTMDMLARKVRAVLDGATARLAP